MLDGYPVLCYNKRKNREAPLCIVLNAELNYNKMRYFVPIAEIKFKTPCTITPKTSNNRTGFAVASLVLSLCSVVLFWIPFILSVPGLIFGILGLKSPSYKGLAIAGIVISSIVLFIWVIILFIAILTAGFAGAYYSAYPYI